MSQHRNVSSGQPPQMLFLSGIRYGGELVASTTGQPGTSRPVGVPVTITGLLALEFLRRWARGRIALVSRGYNVMLPAPAGPSALQQDSK